ncbi:helicase HerA domain-containing protein [Amycolatopsis sp. cmx-4-61]|uniref:helicase HerA domain-containing protein n=1 Tax=Amycolatopsis sp. cmx-4-61 TaxID=2790937 RepID=UPI00397BA89B
MNEEQQRQALAAVRFNSAETPDDVWGTSPFHVEGLHTLAENRIRAGILDAKHSRGPSPIGLALQGQKGVGKTHLLGRVRRFVQKESGYFFLIDISTGRAFWDDVLRAMRSELWRKGDDGELQLTKLLRRLCDKAEVAEAVAKVVRGDAPLTTADLNSFISTLRKADAQVAVECADGLRALALYAAADADLSATGKEYLSSLASDDRRKDRRRWGLPAERKEPREVVAEISRVLALTGPSVAAVDQLDSLITKVADESSGEATGELAKIADGLMQLRERTRRTLSVVACLPTTWNLLQEAATDSFDDRFTETPNLGAIVDSRLGRAVVEKWLDVVYQGIGFDPPHATWPVSSDAFGASWTAYTPRQLLRRVQEHAEACLYGKIRELSSFDEEPVEVVVDVPHELNGEPRYFDEFDRQFHELRRRADVEAAMSKRLVDEIMPDLVQAALKSWITEVGNDDRSWETESLDGAGELHAGLRRTVDEERDVREQWLFRAIASQHGNIVLRKLREAKLASGVQEGVRNRHLVLIHDGGKGWGGGVTTGELGKLEQLGSPRVQISKEDIRTFWALRQLLTKQSYHLLNWLVARKPASRTSLLRQILPAPGQPGGNQRETRPPPSEARPKPEVNPGEFALGLDGEIRIELESLRKHAVIFAGSGTGKTVLLRRIIEECALQGVSAIVLDPNNDLARLGDAWPEPPEAWRSGDAEAAADYLSGTEVVVWTPGRAAGRPLSFHPLPDFAGVRDDEDEFAAAVEAAVARLIPHARVSGGAKAAVRGQAVLREALTHYAREESRSLSGFVDVLAELPMGVSKLTTGTKTAADLAETLRAAMVNDPLLGGSGEPADPAVLLTPSPGKRARISVISFVGLPSDEQRQGFVSQLQLEVFAWIKRHPAADRPLGGLFVMDEAQTIAPSGGWTASTQSTIMLASQARKYGLGLLLATQAPKGLHNQITGNATTQFFGRLNSPAQIAAANDMARAKGSTVGDISRLERGQFYVTGEKFGFRPMRAPLCLSHHPPSPLRLEEVLDRAREGR